MADQQDATSADVLDPATGEDAEAEQLLAGMAADADPDGAEALGDAGKKALDSMKSRWQKERDERKALAAELAKLKSVDQKDTPDPDEIRKQAKAEAAAEILRERALDKAVVKAAGKLADPEDARIYLAEHVEDFIDGDKLDQDAIADAVDELVTKRPYLSAATAKRFQGSADGGARNGKSGPSQLTREDVKRLAKAGKHKEIEQARIDGRLTDLLSGSN